MTLHQITDFAYFVRDKRIAYWVYWWRIAIKKALPLGRADSIFKMRSWLSRDHISRTWAFLAFADFKINLLAFIERCIAVGFNLRVVDE
jgi:hypothetical protein